MNKHRIAGLAGKYVRIRPIALRFDSADNRLDPIDDLWLVLRAGREGIRVKNLRTSHTLELAGDQIHDYRTDPSGRSFGFIDLNGQMWLRGHDAGVEPLLHRTAEFNRG